MIISEYGAGAIPGHHTWPSTQFTEEFQLEARAAAGRAGRGARASRAPGAYES
jgi:hypothetical protein